MELIVHGQTKGLDVLPQSRNTTVASEGIEDSYDRDQFAADHSLYVILSVSDISCETDRSIHFSCMSDSTDSTRNPLGPRIIFL
jgi:hypothetical protein